jgi:hypothetical protein
MSKLINYKFDSSQEEYFYYWLEELYNAGYVDYIVKDRKSFVLNNPLSVNIIKVKKTKTKSTSSNKQLDLIKERTYTPDFIFSFAEKAKGIFFYEENQEENIFPVFNNLHQVYVDNKGEYTRHYSSSITFGDRQAMMWDKHKIYIKIIKTYIKEGKKCLFQQTFTPKKVLQKEVYLKDIPNKNIKKGDSKIKYKIKTLNEFINEQSK